MKRILQISLLTVVIASVVWLVLPRGTKTDASSVSDTAPAEYVAHYFHRTARCYTCLKIEYFAHHVILRDFADQLKQGKLLFLPTNVEVSGNEHFVNDYDLVSQALVLVKYDGTRVEQSRDLSRIWDLVGDSAGFDQYIHDEVATFLGQTP